MLIASYFKVIVAPINYDINASSIDQMISVVQLS